MNTNYLNYTENDFDEFIDNIYNTSISKNGGGMKSPDCFSLYVALIRLQPKTVIECGCWNNVSTNVIRNTLKNVDIIVSDPRKHKIENFKGTDYTGKKFVDFMDIDTTGLDPNETLVIFDDHQNAVQRLLQCNINPHNIIYLIEGNLSLPGIDEKEKNLILSCIISLNNYKGFSVIRTLNKLESSEYLSRLLYRLNKKIIQNEKNNVIDFNINETNNESNESNTLNNNFHISSLKKLKKNKDITRDNINICFLCQIPGISEKVAFSIINHYDVKNFDELIIKIRKDEESLNNIKIETNGKFRKINKNIIDNIKYYLI